MFRITDKIAFFILIVFYSSTLLIGYFFLKDVQRFHNNTEPEKKLHHVVLIQFKDAVPDEKMNEITDAAYALQQIPGVHQLHYGNNVSPEGLNRGYTHSLTMDFYRAVDRDSVYLPHPTHQAFVSLFVPFTSSVLVYDYWD